MWWHVNTEVTNFQMPTYERDTGAPIDVMRTGSHPCMLLYVLNELNMDGQHVVAYKILMVASLYCTEWHGSQKELTLLGPPTQG